MNYDFTKTNKPPMKHLYSSAVSNHPDTGQATDRNQPTGNAVRLAFNTLTGWPALAITFLQQLLTAVSRFFRLAPAVPPLRKLTGRADETAPSWPDFRAETPAPARSSHGIRGPSAASLLAGIASRLSSTPHTVRWLTVLAVVTVHCSLFTEMAQAHITGTVFRDFNGNGVKDNSTTLNEIGVGGVRVTAYNTTGAFSTSVLSSTVVATLGQYTLNIGNANAYRIEFTNLQYQAI